MREHHVKLFWCNLRHGIIGLRLPGRLYRMKAPWCAVLFSERYSAKHLFRLGGFRLYVTSERKSA